MKKKKCQSCHEEFTIFPEDSDFYHKIDAPEPTWCPGCRSQRRLAFRSGRILYKRKVEGLDKEVFACISPKFPFKVYDGKYWWSDKMDAMKYGKEYDFNKPLLKQIEELLHQVGFPHKFELDSVNSPFTNNTGHIKNCYLVFNTGMSENVAYAIDTTGSLDSYDLVKVNDVELSYNLFDCAKCYQVFFSTDCHECSNVWFSKNLVNCQNCFGCVNLRHKKYHIFNKAYSKKEYEEKLKEFNLGSYKSILALEKKAKEFQMKFPNKFMHSRKSIDVSGDYLNNCKNVQNSFINRDLEDCSYCQMILFMPSKECYDIAIAGGELCYELEESGGYQTKFCWLNIPKSVKDHMINLYDMEYTIGSNNSHHLFGCVGLRHKKYCILNKQYTKKEYEELVPKIKKHMDEMPYVDKKGRVYKYGEFFPAELSPFGYNETIANEYFPLSEDKAKEQGFNWYGKSEAEYKATIKAQDIPDDIKDVDDKILKEVVECENKDCQGTKVFRLIPGEYKFYKKQGIPIPRLCHECRHQDRIKLRNPMKLYNRQCMKKGCNTKFQTTYSPDRKEIVYCEKCYQKEIE